MGKSNELKYDLSQHSPYSPDLTPSDLNLFPRLKIFLRGKTFSREEEIKAAVDYYIGGLEKLHFPDRLMTLEHLWMQCIELEGDYE